MTAAVIVQGRERSPSNPAYGEFIQEESPIDMDWMNTRLSPKRRSCINLSSVEPCVKKVVAHLHCLKTQVDDCNRQFLELASESDGIEQQQPNQVSAGSASPKSILVNRGHGVTSAAGSGRTSRLVIEGITTGTPIQKRKTAPFRKNQVTSKKYYRYTLHYINICG